MRVVFHTFIILFLIHTGLAAQENKIPAQQIVAELDKVIKLPAGIIKASLTHIQRTGQTISWNITIFKSGRDALFLFERGYRGLETKLLFKSFGDKVYSYNPLSRKLFGKNEEEKYEPLLHTGFSFIDLSGYSYQANFNPSFRGSIDIDNEKHYRISMLPIIPFVYTKLVTIVNEKTLKPYRIDFYGKDGVIFKTINFKYGPVRIKDKEAKEEERLARMESLELETGSISVFEITEIDQSITPDNALFELENFTR